MLFGLRVWDVFVTCLIGALIPVVLVHMLDRERGTDERRGREHLWIAAAWTFATPAFFLAAIGRVWFTAQIVGALFMALYVSTAWKVRRPAFAGLFLGMAVACRPFMLLALPFFALEWWREGRRPSALLHFLVPLVTIGIVLASYNYVRFEDIFEFGHKYLDIRWQVRMQEVGMFSSSYLGRNLQCLFSLMPQVTETAPFFKVSMHGSSLLLGSPWILAGFAARTAFPQRRGLLISLVLVALPALFYQNSGQLQFSYRFAVDWLPLLLPLLVFGGALATRNKRWVFAGIVAISMLFHGYGAYRFGHEPGKLFVTDPPLWPFGDELAPAKKRAEK
jgi:hypothetical protein